MMSQPIFLDRSSFWTALKTIAILSFAQLLYLWVFTASRGPSYNVLETHYYGPETILISIDPVFIYIRNIITPEDISYFLNKW